MPIVVAIGAGLILGSFLSVLIERWPHWRGVVGGRSECPHCHHMLAWYDLVPLVSWVMLGGKCRYCHAAISPRYPMYELVMAGAMGIVAAQSGTTIADPLMTAGFVALFFFDLRHMVLPDIIVVPLAAIALIDHYWIFLTYPAFLLFAIWPVVLFGLLYWASRGRWLGLGDVKMGLVVGLWFITLSVPVTISAIWIAAFWGVAMMVLGKANRKTPLPFGAFWAAVCIAVMVIPQISEAWIHLGIFF